MWHSKNARWEAGFAVLANYAQRTGHGRVPTGHIEGGFRLGQWVGVQRRSYDAGSLSMERVTRLEGIGGWAWNRHDHEWNSAFSMLESFVARESHARVPSDCLENGFRLGQWAKVQRRGHSQGTLTDDRERRLESLPGWAWDLKEARWEQGIALLKDFIGVEGNARVPQKFVAGEFRLGSWVNTRRLDHRAGRLSSEQIAELEALPGWTWDARENP